MVEGQVTSRDEATRQNVTEAVVQLFEDGSGLFRLKRGRENITISWTPEDRPVFELHADCNGIEGTLVASKEMIAPESPNGH
jgi:hypothetical protein